MGCVRPGSLHCRLARQTGKAFRGDALQEGCKQQGKSWASLGGGSYSKPPPPPLEQEPGTTDPQNISQGLHPSEKQKTNTPPKLL